MSNNSNNNNNNITKITFVSKIASMGDQKRYVPIPKIMWDDIEDLQKHRQVKITIELV